MRMFDFLDDKEDWNDWDGMPEFVQPSTASISNVVIHFETVEDREAFSKLIGKNITAKTKGVFFPVKPPREKLEYVDEP
jgi:hypothetical protein